jgi:hypothetical protein
LTLQRNRHVARFVAKSLPRFALQSALFGLAFSGIEQSLVYVRAKVDLWNPSVAGIVTGAIIGQRLGGNDLKSISAWSGLGFTLGLFSGVLRMYDDALEKRVKSSMEQKSQQRDDESKLK